MDDLEKIFDFIENACVAFDLFSGYYRISYDKSKERYDDEGQMIDDGFIIETGWRDSDPLYGTTFDNACKCFVDDLFDKLERDDIGDYFVSLLSFHFLSIDEIQRIALMKSIVRKSFCFFIHGNYTLFSLEDRIFNHLMSVYKTYDGRKLKDNKMYTSLCLVTELINEYYSFLNGITTLCSDYDINLHEIAVSVFDSTSINASLRLDILCDNIGTGKNLSAKRKNDVILKWEGQSNVLTDMFRQAKNRGYLVNSIPDIAIFLKENFSCFAKTKLSTIETQLKNNNSSANAIPKEEKRIKLEE